MIKRKLTPDIRTSIEILCRRFAEHSHLTGHHHNKVLVDTFWIIVLLRNPQISHYDYKKKPYLMQMACITLFISCFDIHAATGVRQSLHFWWNRYLIFWARRSTDTQHQLDDHDLPTPHFGHTKRPLKWWVHFLICPVTLPGLIPWWSITFMMTSWWRGSRFFPTGTSFEDFSSPFKDSTETTWGRFEVATTTMLWSGSLCPLFVFFLFSLRTCNV